jgi:hypothetical protein
MPNWVYNGVTIQGPTKVVDRFIEMSGRRNYIYKEEDKEQCFSYGAFILPPKNKLKEYHEAHGNGPDGPYGNTEFNWYNWNVRHWGVKWDATNPEFTDNTTKEQKSKGIKEVYLNWESPWSVPEPVLIDMVSKFPKLFFEGKSEEEQGWGANWDGIQGEFSASYWDIPSSHADWANPDTLDNIDGCVCGWNDDPTEWYGDCPDRDEAIREYTKEQLEGAK